MPCSSVLHLSRSSDVTRDSLSDTRHASSYTAKRFHRARRGPHCNGLRNSPYDYRAFASSEYRSLACLELGTWGNDVTYRGKVIAEENRVGDEIRQEEERTRKRRDSRFPL